MRSLYSYTMTIHSFRHDFRQKSWFHPQFYRDSPNLDEISKARRRYGAPKKKSIRQMKSVKAKADRKSKTVQLNQVGNKRAGLKSIDSHFDSGMIDIEMSMEEPDPKDQNHFNASEVPDHANSVINKHSCTSTLTSHPEPNGEHSCKDTTSGREPNDIGLSIGATPPATHQHATNVVSRTVEFEFLAACTPRLFRSVPVVSAKPTYSEDCNADICTVPYVTTSPLMTVDPSELSAYRNLGKEGTTFLLQNVTPKVESTASNDAITKCTACKDLVFSPDRFVSAAEIFRESQTPNEYGFFPLCSTGVDLSSILNGPASPAFETSFETNDKQILPSSVLMQITLNGENILHSPLVAPSGSRKTSVRKLPPSFPKKEPKIMSFSAPKTMARDNSERDWRNKLVAAEFVAKDDHAVLQQLVALTFDSERVSQSAPV